VEFALLLAVMAGAALVMYQPLRRGAEPERDEAVAELAAAKHAKLREIHEAELDFRTGKLSRADWRTLDRSLRREAAEVLRRLDAAQGVEHPG
jgi:hypothetical protein